MRVFVRLLAFSALVAAVACNSDSTEPSRPPSRAALNGVWQCASAEIFYYRFNQQRPSQSERWRTGTCGQYIDLTNPSRRDSIDTTAFQIEPNDRISRPVEFAPGLVQYDRTRGILLATYPEYPTARYRVVGNALVFRFDGRDLTGDGRPDSLRLRFVKALAR